MAEFRITAETPRSVCRDRWAAMSRVGTFLTQGVAAWPARRPLPQPFRRCGIWIPTTSRRSRSFCRSTTRR